ncbi:hypothetical protein EXIGLDRAFT_725957 [Exidia glandulosa HHB12029]|uniref:Uncharacterized protein n=1 Tax=Exidia glandulosa HHB12029 TaxID=1314781 RepID=A0A165DXR6_EXIGL|nr:hypothetical protein EXIGLDRAFT_725957 [Exidia glandulosa HHB12029]
MSHVRQLRRPTDVRSNLMLAGPMRLRVVTLTCASDMDARESRLRCTQTNTIPRVWRIGHPVAGRRSATADLPNTRLIRKRYVYKLDINYLGYSTVIMRLLYMIM